MRSFLSLLQIIMASAVFAQGWRSSSEQKIDTVIKTSIYFDKNGEAAEDANGFHMIKEKELSNGQLFF